MLWAMPVHELRGVHMLRPVHGPLPGFGTVHRSTSGVMHWQVFCSKCKRSASDTTRWLELARSSGNDAPAFGTWVQPKHVFAASSGGACVSCGMIPDRSLAFLRSRQCPAWQFEENSLRDELRSQVYRQMMALAGLWRSFAHGVKVLPANDPMPPSSCA